MNLAASCFLLYFGHIYKCILAALKSVFWLHLKCFECIFVCFGSIRMSVTAHIDHEKGMHLTGCVTSCSTEQWSARRKSLLQHGSWQPVHSGNCRCGLQGLQGHCSVYYTRWVMLLASSWLFHWFVWTCSIHVCSVIASSWSFHWFVSTFHSLVQLIVPGHFTGLCDHVTFVFIQLLLIVLGRFTGLCECLLLLIIWILPF